MKVFEPGTRVRLKGGPMGYVLLILHGGYVSEDTWHFYSTSRPMTDEHFEEVT